jgi:hypothetical protein
VRHIKRFELEDDVQAAVEQLRRRPMTVEELATTGPLGRRRAELLVYCFLITKQIDLSPAPAEQLPLTRPPASRAVAGPTVQFPMPASR